MEIPGEGFFVAVDLKSFQGFVSPGIAGGFEDGGGAVFEAGEEGAGVVDSDGMLLTGLLVDALLDEGFGHGRDPNDVAIDPAGAVDVMGQKVSGNTGTRGRGIKTPECFAALGEFFGPCPGLQEVGTVMVNASQLTTIDDLLGKCNGRKKAVIIPNEVGQAASFNRFDHLEALLSVQGEGLFAKDHFAILNGGHRDIVVGIVWRADVDGVDIVALHQLTPIGFGISVAPLLGEGFDFVFGASADDLTDGDVFSVEKVLKLGVCI